MGTTKVIAELLLIGGQAIVWILLLVDLPDDLQLPQLLDSSAVIVAALLGICYSIGALFDAATALLEDLANSIIRPNSRKPWFYSRERKQRAADFILIHKHNESFGKRLDDHYLQLRFLRSTSANLLIICGVLAAQRQCLWTALTAILFALSFLGWLRRRALVSAYREELLLEIRSQSGM